MKKRFSKYYVSVAAVFCILLIGLLNSSKNERMDHPVVSIDQMIGVNAHQNFVSLAKEHLSKNHYKVHSYKNSFVDSSKADLNDTSNDDSSLGQKKFKTSLKFLSYYFLSYFLFGTPSFIKGAIPLKLLFFKSFLHNTRYIAIRVLRL